MLATMADFIYGPVIFLAPHQTPIKIEVIGLGWEAHGIVGKNLNFWYRFTVGLISN